MAEHEVRRYAGTWFCMKCGRSWDTDDTAPECEPVAKTAPSVGYRNEYKPPLKKEPSAPKGKRITSEHFAELRKAIDTNDFSKFK